MSASGRYGSARVAAGIVARVDLTAGPEVDDLLEAHLRAGGGRVKGIRQTAAFDPSDAIPRNPSAPPAHLYLSAAFRSGFARLARFGLSFDAWVFHPQLAEVIDLARSFPEQPIALDHLGTPLGLGPYAGRPAEVFADWERSIRELACCENVFIKLGGLGYTFGGFDFPHRAQPAQVAQIASAWRPYIETCIDAFGSRRCMFESNFPADGISCSYRTLWNTFKQLTAGASVTERERLFCGTAKYFYRLG
jgi:predicted TIM-barrel fold metal-dependent hydrolase